MKVVFYKNRANMALFLFYDETKIKTIYKVEVYKHGMWMRKKISRSLESKRIDPRQCNQNSIAKTSGKYAICQKCCWQSIICQFGGSSKERNTR
jgi:hypothetical protein